MKFLTHDSCSTHMRRSLHGNLEAHHLQLDLLLSRLFLFHSNFSLGFRMSRLANTFLQGTKN